jgi:hypothetical protein
MAVASVGALVTALIVFSPPSPPAKQQTANVLIGGPFELVGSRWDKGDGQNLYR